MSHAPRPPAAGLRSASKGDPSGPLVYDVRRLGRRAGAMRESVRQDVPAPAGLGTDLVGVREGSPLEVDVRLESVTEGVLVTGTVTATIAGECARCLDPISQPLVVDLQELFAWPDSVTDETTDEDELPRIWDDRLDLEPAVRDAVVLALPWTPVCRPDCPGLCPTCGVRWDDLPDDHTHEVLDPRWAALAAFTDGEPDTEIDRTTNRGE